MTGARVALMSRQAVAPVAVGSLRLSQPFWGVSHVVAAVWTPVSQCVRVSIGHPDTRHGGGIESLYERRRESGGCRAQFRRFR